MFKKIFFTIIFFILSLFSGLSFSLQNNIYENNITYYLKTLKSFECNFIQASPDGSVSEGKMIYSDNKVKINYETPSKITFVVKGNKAMYFNEDLMEVEYFNPKKTALKTIQTLFDLENASKESYEIYIKEKVLEVKLIANKIENVNSFSVFFQTDPMELKKIEWRDEVGKSVFSILNIINNKDFDKKVFSMVNPTIN